jgi:cobalt/nickel transport system permease protein
LHHSHIDRFARGDSPVHRLDPRGKLIAVIAYTAVLISFDRYAVFVLAPMAVGPLAALWFGRVPVTFALRRAALLSPFILMLCLASPFYDDSPRALAFGPWQWEIAGGYLTAVDVALKFTLSVLALTALTGTTIFASLLEAMRRMRLPRVLTMQIGLLYRYLFLLLDEAMRLRRARDFRGAARAPTGRRLAAAAGVIGGLFIRSLDRSERIHIAMAARGYRGEPHGLDLARWHGRDTALLLATAAYLLLCRWALPAIA